MKRATILFLLLLFGLMGTVWAGDQIGVFANNNTNSIQTIDPQTVNTYGCFLNGNFGSYGGGLFDVVITPDGKTAIVSNFGDSKIFFIDISGSYPDQSVSPVIRIYDQNGFFIPFFAEDMAITPDGKHVLVTDGGFSPRVAIVDIQNRTLVRVVNLRRRYANAIDIAPDGKTVLTADYFGKAIHSYSLKITPAGTYTLKYTNTADTSIFRPVNVTISPDGKTVIAAIAGSSQAVICLIDSQGKVCYMGSKAMPSKNGQSCVFSHDGTRAYYLSNSQNKGTLVHVLNVLGPGIVSVSGISLQVEPMRGTSQLFGVDTIALDPAGNFLYVTNPTVSGGIAGVSVLDLTIGSQVDLLPACGIPTGIAFSRMLQ